MGISKILPAAAAAATAAAAPVRLLPPFVRQSVMTTPRWGLIKPAK